ncbi:MAG: T9SS type A sorting domain-containing protein [Bacteroidales bacterium]|nr:T9SS type A sorting domain-containing protein [Bacteroidales bacterium]
MKPLFTSLLLALLMPLLAQNYHPLVETGKLWSTRHYDGCNYYDPYSEYEKFSGDTSFSGYSWMKLWSTKDSNLLPWSLVGFMREDEEHRVFFASAGGGDPWMYYDFGCSVGDTISPLLPEIKYVVDSITPFELINGEFRNRYMLRFINPWGGSDTCYDYWIEGIGGNRGLRCPIFCEMVGDDPMLICWWEGDTLKYHNTFFEECAIITGIGNPASGIREVRIFPNPASKFFTLELMVQPQGISTFSLMDLSGKTLLDMRISQEKTLIHLPHWVTAGVYLFQISDDSDWVSSGKLIIE